MKSISTLLMLLAVLSLASSCKFSKEKNTQEYVKLVKTVEVEELNAISQKHFPSVVEEAAEVNLAFRVAGPIAKMLVREGDYVEEGQLVAEMDPRDYEVQQSAAQSQVMQLRSEYERVAELRKRNAVSVNDYEKMKAGKEMAEQKLKNANDQLSDTKLYAPFSGYITKVNFKDGEMVNHGTVIATMVDVSLLKVEIKVPASFYILRDSIHNVECTQEDIVGKVYPLELYANNVKANNNGLYTLYFYHRPEPGCLLSSGMNVNVSVEFSAPEATRLIIPINAIAHNDEGGDCVWVLAEDSTVTKRMIKADDQVKYGQVKIIEGLNEGETIVVGGLHLLREGEKVRVVPKPSSTNVGNLL